LRAGLVAKFPQMSVRRWCKIVGLRRVTHYKRVKEKAEQAKEQADLALVAEFKKVRAAHQSWGFELLYAYLRQQKGLLFCKKRGHRLYKQAGLSLHRVAKKPKIQRKYQALLAPQCINEGWALDFMSDMVVGANKAWVRVINVIDECSRRNLWVEAHKNIPAQKVKEILDNLLKTRGCPSYIRTDNGPEFISDTIAEWAKGKGIEHRFIQAGKPTQNGLIERLNGTLRRECLNLQWFHSLSELNNYLEEWYQSYNFERPHSSLGYLTPVQFEKQNHSLYFNVVAGERR